MPRVTLLDFFKSQTPEPFAPVTHSTESFLSEARVASRDDAEVSKQRDSRRRSSEPYDAPSKDEQATPLTSKQGLAQSNSVAPDTDEPSPEPHLPGLTIVAVQTDHLPALKKLTGNLLPVRYPDKFFDGAVNEAVPAAFSRVALIHGKPVGWIRCRLDPFPEPTVPPSDTKPIYNRIYVQVLCLLAPYRGLGIATILLDTVTAMPLIQVHDVAHIYAHVWESNEEALEWYQSRGFSRVLKVDQYYRKLRPNGAWIVKKDLDRI